MATFTQVEAEACMITRCDRVDIDGVFDRRVIAVTDDNGIGYSWADTVTGNGASTANIKTAARTMLMTMEKLVVTLVTDEGIVGDTIG